MERAIQNPSVEIMVSGWICLTKLFVFKQQLVLERGEGWLGWRMSLESLVHSWQGSLKGLNHGRDITDLLKGAPVWFSEAGPCGCELGVPLSWLLPLTANS